MNWDALGAISNFVGAVAIVSTLLYLTQQTRLLRRTAVSASRSASAIAVSEIDREIARDPELARIAFKSLNSEPRDFDELEWFRFTTFARSLVGLYEEQYMQSRQGTTDPEMGEIHVAAMVGFLEHAAWSAFWKLETRGDAWRRDFVSAVNAAKAKARVPGMVIAGRED